MPCPGYGGAIRRFLQSNWSHLWFGSIRDWGHADTGFSRASEWTRRRINLVLALIAIIVTLPIMLFVAVLVRLTSRGPVLYTQVRVGLDRRTPVGGGPEPSSGARPRWPALHDL